MKKLGLSFILALIMMGLVSVVIFLLTKYPVVVGFSLMFSAMWVVSYLLVKMLED